MNTNEIKFDPMTGQPIQNNMNNNVQPNNTQTNVQPQPQNIQPVVPVAPIEPQISNTTVEVQPAPIEQSINTTDTNVNNMQSIPTVDQSQQQFINNTQSLTAENKVEKKQRINWTFLIILFVIILAAIFFLFPYLQKNL